MNTHKIVSTQINILFLKLLDFFFEGWDGSSSSNKSVWSLAKLINTYKHKKYINFKLNFLKRNDQNPDCGIRSFMDKCHVQMREDLTKLRTFQQKHALVSNYSVNKDTSSARL